MIKKLLPLFLSAFTLFSCDNNENDSKKNSWIGGEIVNPKTDYVIITKDNVLLDTLKLDKKNSFLYEVENTETGLYSFNHNEYQIFFLEPGDSLLLRVNTMDFDESLTYTGNGSGKNNLLMDFFLTNEEENHTVQPWYQLDPATFEFKIDSLKQERIAKLDNFKIENDLSDEFENIAMDNIDYDYYSKKEQYVTANANKLKDKKFPKNFFDYRESVDFNRESLFASYPYNRFLNRLFDNLAFSKYSDKANFNRNSFEHIFHEVKLIDSLVSNQNIKDNLLRTNVRRYLLNEKDADKERKIKELFIKTDNNPEHKKEIERLFEAAIKLTPGKELPQISLVSYDNLNKNLKEIITKPTVFYFWTDASEFQYRNLHARASELKSKFPEFNFIAINTDTNFKIWKRTVARNNFNPQFEYQFDNRNEAQQTLIINSMTKSIIADSNGKILIGNSNLYGNAIEEELLGFINR